MTEHMWSFVLLCLPAGPLTLVQVCHLPNALTLLPLLLARLSSSLKCECNVAYTRLGIHIQTDVSVAS